MDEIIVQAIIHVVQRFINVAALPSEFSFGNVAFLKFSKVMPIPATHTHI